MLTRRQFIGSSAAALALSLLGSGAKSSKMSTSRRFLFIHAEGGWDPLCVFAPLFDHSLIQMETEAEPITFGDLRLIDGPGREPVRSFFEEYAAQTLVLNGVSTRSVNHETCQAVILTGTTSAERTDWATLLASEVSSTVTLPHVVFSGPTFSGDQSVLVSRAEGALQPLISGDLLTEVEPYAEGFDEESEVLIQRFLRARTTSLKSVYPDQTITHNLHEANMRAHQLLDMRKEVTLESGGETLQQAKNAIKALSDGVCQCATISTGFSWDTHIDNSEQTPLFSDLFSTLDQIMRSLKNTTGPDGLPLSEDTVVVVMSEMGRTPAFNATGGRDHWPFTSLMMIGPGVRGGQVVGGYNDGYIGIGVDPQTLTLDPSRSGISAEDVGATLLTLGGLDSKRVLPFAQPLLGLLS